MTEQKKKEFFEVKGYDYDLEKLEKEGKAESLKNQEIRAEWEWIQSYVQGEVEKAKVQSRQEAYMIVKDHVIEQTLGPTVNKESLINLLNTLFDVQEEVEKALREKNPRVWSSVLGGYIKRGKGESDLSGLDKFQLQDIYLNWRYCP